MNAIHIALGLAFLHTLNLIENILFSELFFGPPSSGGWIILLIALIVMALGFYLAFKFGWRYSEMYVTVFLAVGMTFLTVLLYLIVNKISVRNGSVITTWMIYNAFLYGLGIIAGNLRRQRKFRMKPLRP